MAFSLLYITTPGLLMGPLHQFEQLFVPKLGILGQSFYTQNHIHRKVRFLRAVIPYKALARCVQVGKTSAREDVPILHLFFSIKILKKPNFDGNSPTNHYRFNTFSIDLPEIPGPTLGEEDIQVVS